MGDSQVGGLYHAKAQRMVLADRAGGGLSFVGKSNSRRGRKGGQE